MEQEDVNLETLLKWASQIGISDSHTLHSDQSLSSSSLGHSLSVSFFPNAGGRGLSAERDLRQGELVLRVPKSALLTRDAVCFKDDRLSQALKPHHSSLSPVQILGVCLLYEMGKGKNSWWYPYLVNLPPSYDILATFGEFEKQAMQVLFSLSCTFSVDEAIWAVEKAVSKAESEWKEAYAIMKELNLKPRLLSFRAWLWAYATISSRTLHVPWDEAGCLCPVGDLFNYAAPGEDVEPPCLSGDTDDSLDRLDSLSQRLTDGGFMEDVDAYCFYARRYYKKGEQVLLGYGTYTNLELLEHYGFLLNENPNEKVFIPLEPEIFSSNTWPKELMYIHENGKPSFALLSALRLWATPRNHRRSIARLAYSGSQISSENEVLVMKWISEKCNFLLKSLPTSSEEDSLVLDSIDKLQDSASTSEPEEVLACPSDQIRTFFEAQGSQIVDGGSQLLSCKKIKQAMDRWRLAIQWRFRYKEILIDCVSFCSKAVDSLSCQNVPLERKHLIMY